MEKRGVAEAVIKCQNNLVGKVMCPFCNKTHQHGLMGLKSLAGQFRGSDCHRGDYRIVDKMV
jgi:hypothetical protein